jgi:hypothetical protein
MSASLCHGNGSHAAFKGGGSPNLTGRSGQGNHRSPSPQFFQALLYSGQEPVRRTTSMGPVNELLLPVAAILLFGLVYAVNWALTVRRERLRRRMHARYWWVFDDKPGPPG